MPAAKDVAPAKWATKPDVLFDNDIYSVTAGDYEGKWRPATANATPIEAEVTEKATRCAETLRAGAMARLLVALYLQSVRPGIWGRAC